MTPKRKGSKLSAWPLVVALLPAMSLGLLHLGGARSAVRFLSGAGPIFDPATSEVGLLGATPFAGVLYVLSYFGVLWVTPVLILATVLAAAHRRLWVARGQPHSRRWSRGYSDEVPRPTKIDHGPT